MNQPQRKPPQSSEQSPARILLVDDHPVVREGLTARLEQHPGFSVCGTAADAHEAMAAVESLKPDLCVTDLSMGGKPGIELVKDLRHQYPAIPILVLSIHDEMLWAERVLRAGASGYIMKSQATTKVIEAIERILAGGVWVSDKVNSALLQKVSGRPTVSTGSPLERLTDRELEVFQLLGQGIGPKEIASKLYLSVKTVEVHREHIKSKLQLKSTPELIRYAVTHLLNES